MIKAKAITHMYDHDKALDGVDIKIDQGNFIALCGESGSGKSTLLSILSTLLQPTQGELEILGQKSFMIKDIDTFRRHNIGFVFQFHYLINYLNIKENIELAMDEKDENRIDDLLRYLNIESIKTKLPHEISGGQRQRAAIARAVANTPKIIFADEPTGNLDSKNSQKVFELLRNISDKKTTVLVATHDTNLAKLADKIYEVKDGKISDYR